MTSLYTLSFLTHAAAQHLPEFYVLIRVLLQGPPATSHSDSTYSLQTADTVRSRVSVLSDAADFKNQFKTYLSTSVFNSQNLLLLYLNCIFILCVLSLLGYFA